MFMQGHLLSPQRPRWLARTCQQRLPGSGGALLSICQGTNLMLGLSSETQSTTLALLPFWKGPAHRGRRSRPGRARCTLRPDRGRRSRPLHAHAQACAADAAGEYQGSTKLQYAGLSVTGKELCTLKIPS